MPHINHPACDRGDAMTLSELTPRRQQVARMSWIEGLSCKEIGRRLGISMRTVEVHREWIRDQLGERNGVRIARRLALEGVE